VCDSEKILAAIDDIRGLLRDALKITRSDVPVRYTRRELCEMKGKSVSFANANPWMLPNYGIPDERGRPYAWYLRQDEIDAYMATPIDELYRRWAELPKAERRRLTERRVA
jgi:hypothetical protein